MILRRDSFDATLLDRLARTGERLPHRLRTEITAYGEVAVKPLIKLIGRGGWGEVHAIRLIRELGASRAIGPLIDLLVQAEPDSIAGDETIQALGELGEPVIEPVLQAWAANDDPERLAALGCVLAKTPGRREDVRETLESLLPRHPLLGCALLGEYGDPAALSALSTILDEREIDWQDPAPIGNMVIVEAAEAIRDLGGELTLSQRDKLRAVDAMGAAWRRSISGQPLEARSLPGRNDPCWCGSGQKYKRCHLREDELVPT